jgi:heme-degrading monooxygenase HmoA
VIALVFSYETDDAAAFEEAYGANGSWAGFFRGAPGYVGTELLRDVEHAARYLVVDRWESRETYNGFVEAHRDEYMRRVDETAFLHRQELRLGTFENVWEDERADPAAP